MLSFQKCYKNSPELKECVTWQPKLDRIQLPQLKCFKALKDFVVFMLQDLNKKNKINKGTSRENWKGMNSLKSHAVKDLFFGVIG